MKDIFLGQYTIGKRPRTGNFRGVKKALVIGIFEGKGTEESLARVVDYVIDLDGKVIGVLDPAPEKKGQE